jgi:hypothetical protein
MPTRVTPQSTAPPSSASRQHAGRTLSARTHTPSARTGNRTSNCAAVYRPDSRPSWGYTRTSRPWLAHVVAQLEARVSTGRTASLRYPAWRPWLVDLVVLARGPRDPMRRARDGGLCGPTHGPRGSGTWNSWPTTRTSTPWLVCLFAGLADLVGPGSWTSRPHTRISSPRIVSRFAQAPRAGLVTGGLSVWTLWPCLVAYSRWRRRRARRAPDHTRPTTGTSAVSTSQSLNPDRYRYQIHTSATCQGGV